MVISRKLRRMAAAAVAVSALSVIATGPASAADNDGSFTLVNYGSGKCIEVVPDSNGNYFTNGNVIQQRTCDGSPAQRWYISTLRIEGLLADHLVNRFTNQCMDVKDGNQADRAVVQQWTCNADGTSMAWIPGPSSLDPAARSFTNWRSGKCIDIPGGSGQDFAKLQQYRCTDPNTAQSFFRI